MGLEAVTYIDDLVITNPVDVDFVEEGDDHLRNIKKAIRNAMAATATDTQLKHGSGGTSVLKTTAAGIQVIDPTTNNPAITFNDGSADVIKLHENGGAAYLDNQTLLGNLELRTSHLATADEPALRAVPDGAVTVFHAGSAILATAATGIAITGSLSELVNGSAADANLKARNTLGGLNLRVDAGAALFLDQQDAAGAFEKTWLKGNRGGSVELYYDGILAARTATQGLYIQRGTGSTTTMYWRDASGTVEGHLNTRGSASFQLKAYNPGRGFDVIGRDAGDTADNTLISSDPDAGVELYYQGNKVFDTTNEGIDVQDGNGSAPRIRMLSDGGTLLGQLYYSGGVVLRSEVNSAEFALQGTDSGGTIQTLMTGDPDGRSELWHDGNLRIYTRSDGLEIVPNGAGSKYLVLASSVGTDQAQFYHTDTNLFIRNLVNGGGFKLQADNAGGTIKTFIDFDPDLGTSGAIGFNGATPVTRPNYTVTGISAVRSLSSSSSTSTVRSVLGTVINDLIANGIFL